MEYPPDRRVQKGHASAHDNTFNIQVVRRLSKSL